MVTDEQVKVLRKVRMEGKTQETAAAKAGMSVRTARAWESGLLPSSTEKPRVLGVNYFSPLTTAIFPQLMAPKLAPFLGDQLARPGTDHLPRPMTAKAAGIGRRTLFNYLGRLRVQAEHAVERAPQP